MKGSAVTYILASMKQEIGEQPMVTQVIDAKNYCNFEIFSSSKGRLLKEEFELHRNDCELKKAFSLILKLRF